jgi:hypothetical protein
MMPHATQTPWCKNGDGPPYERRTNGSGRGNVGAYDKSLDASVARISAQMDLSSRRTLFAVRDIQLPRRRTPACDGVRDVGQQAAGIRIVRFARPGSTADDWAECSSSGADGVGAVLWQSLQS